MYSRSLLVFSQKMGAGETPKVMYSSMTDIAALCIRIMLSYLFAVTLTNMAIPYMEGVCWVFMML